MSRLLKADLLTLAEQNNVDVDESNTVAEITSALEAAGVDVNGEEESEEVPTYPPEVGDAERAEHEGNERNRVAEVANAEAWKQREADELEADAERVAASGSDALDAAIAQKRSELDALEAQKG